MKPLTLVLVRHGNTFGPTDKVVWVGSRNDLPLVDSGIAQANSLGHFFSSGSDRPDAIFSSPLQRARQTAQAIADSCGINELEISSALNELDYGPWSGLSSEEIVERYGAAEFERWNSEGQWPSGEIFGGSEDRVIQGIQQFAQKLTQRFSEGGKVICVSSNGVLRYFLKLVEGEFMTRLSSREIKVKTGNFCILRLSEGLWQLDCWNVSPQE